jgi:hypothetical protein
MARCGGVSNGLTPATACSFHLRSITTDGKGDGSQSVFPEVT